jgi:molybdopterin converting factor subunit 1
MQVRVLFFGATADETGKRSVEFQLRDLASVQTALDDMLTSFPKLSSHNLLFAVNQEYVTEDRMLQDGDELAIFTAVSGG